MVDERTPPERVRISGLQEAQLPAIVEVERACAAMHGELGAGAPEASPRTLPEIVALTRDHDVHVAEADYQVAGYLAWRDEPPGIGYITQIAVHPDYQRFGIGLRLLDEMQDRAWGYGIRFATARVRERAGWAIAFFRKAGFQPLGDNVPDRVLRWRDEQLAAGRTLTEPGEVLMWAALLPPDVDEAPTWDGSTGT